jgi:uncharacterized protein YraI
MYPPRFIAIAAIALGGMILAGSAQAEQSGYYRVTGVEKDDFLKMRAGPGTGYKIIVGLPEDTVLWVSHCERSGSTSWCKVSLKHARGLRGYVSSAYLSKM